MGGGFGAFPFIAMLAMAFFWLLVIGGLGLLVVWLFRRDQGQMRDREVPPPASRPLEILRERYARGEITRDEFDQMRRDLEAR